MHLKRLILTALMMTVVVTVVAKPARRGLFTVTQPDGTTLQLQQVGDEYSHHLVTEDGKLVIKEGDTYYYKNVTANGVNVNTGVVAREASHRTGIDAAVSQSLSDIDVAQLRLEKMQRRLKGFSASRATAQSGMGLFNDKFPRKGKIKALVLLVEYSDVSFKLSDPKGYFTDMLTREGFNLYNGTGSVHDYFVQNSRGQFDPEFDVFGPVKLAKPMAYYGANDNNGDDVKPHEMVIDACRALNSQINFADYDMDNDGEVDNIYVFYAGWGEASHSQEPDCIWPHSWDISEGAGESVFLDGKLLNRYACSNEWEDWGETTSYERPDGVGTFIHEFSHVMGIPDLYNTGSRNVYGTPGSWSVMDYGPYNHEGCTPPNYSTFERNALGWIDPYVISGASSYDLSNLADVNEACIIPTTKSTEFFLIENRQKTGWDAYIPGHGMLIWHVDFDQNVWGNQTINNTQSHLRVQIEWANDNRKDESGWAFPGTSNKTSFTNTTTPSMKTWNGTNLNLPITDITEKGGIISFDVAGGSASIDSPVARYDVTPAGDGFVLSWDPVQGAVDYQVSVYEYTMIDQSEVYDSSDLPAGWSQSLSGTYATKGNFTTGTCSLKFGKSGDNLSTCVYDADVKAISFWHKGMSTNNSASSLAVEGLVNSSWVKIQDVKPTNNSGVEYSNTNLPAGVRQVKFTYSKASGNMAVDNITVRYAGEGLGVYNNMSGISTSGATSYKVTLGANHSSVYVAEVRASDGRHLSPGNRLEIKINASAGVDTVITDNEANAPVEYYNMQGVKIEHPSAGNIYIRRQGATVSKVRL